LTVVEGFRIIPPLCRKSIIIDEESKMAGYTIGDTVMIHKIVARDDLPNGDLGYPTTIEYEPGRLLLCYYGQEPDGVTCLQGTYVDLAM
jgi:hypothetical protein